MTLLAFELKKFVFEREGWEEALVVDMGESRCAVLTGKNGGGKTLAISLEKFCDAIVNPNSKKLHEIARLVDDAKVRRIIVRFGYEFMDS